VGTKKGPGRLGTFSPGPFPRSQWSRHSAGNSSQVGIPNVVGSGVLIDQQPEPPPGIDELHSEAEFEPSGLAGLGFGCVSPVAVSPERPAALAWARAGTCSGRCAGAASRSCAARSPSGATGCSTPSPAATAMRQGCADDQKYR
jgi:hypothetical protein